MRHEVLLAKRGFAALFAVAALASGIGVLVDGRTGALSALMGAGVIAGNHALAVASTGWARRLSPGVIAVGFAVFGFRMLLVFATLAVLAGIDWIHSSVLAGTFCAALAATLLAEGLSYARGSYIPAWRLR